jgi:hypothetical protein
MEVMLPLAGHSPISGDKTEKKWKARFWVKLNCALKILGSQQFPICQGDTNFLHQVELIFVDWTNWFYLYEQNHLF